MATGTVKVLVSVEIPIPTSNVEKLKGAEINKELRNSAEERVLDALNLADLQPQILRVRVAREDKD